MPADKETSASFIQSLDERLIKRRGANLVLLEQLACVKMDEHFQSRQ
jgi:hypothetical protein